MNAHSDPLLCHDYAILLLDCGLRPEEANRLRWEHLDLTERVLFVPSGKTESARRRIPLTPRVSGMLDGGVHGPLDLGSSLPQPKVAISNQAR